MNTTDILGMPIDAVRALQKGTLLTLLEPTSGEGADGEEHVYPVGTTGEVFGLAVLPAPQGLAVTVVIGPQDGDKAIVNVFDEGDACFPFALAAPAPAVLDKD